MSTKKTAHTNIHSSTLINTYRVPILCLQQKYSHYKTC